MAGQLTIDTLKASSGVLATQNGMTGIAKAWVNFQGSGTVATIRGSFNVSSITRNSTGYYTVNMTTALADANYSAVAGSQINNGGSTFNLPFIFGNPSSPFYTAPTTSAFTIYFGGQFGNAASAEPQYATVAVFGN